MGTELIHAMHAGMESRDMRPAFWTLCAAFSTILQSDSRKFSQTVNIPGFQDQLSPLGSLEIIQCAAECCENTSERCTSHFTSLDLFSNKENQVETHKTKMKWQDFFCDRRWKQWYERCLQCMFKTSHRTFQKMLIKIKKVFWHVVIE